jgi:hypothetical protein
LPLFLPLLAFLFVIPAGNLLVLLFCILPDFTTP